MEPQEASESPSVAKDFCRKGTQRQLAFHLRGYWVLVIATRVTRQTTMSSQSPTETVLPRETLPSWL